MSLWEDQRPKIEKDRALEGQGVHKIAPPRRQVVADGAISGIGGPRAATCRARLSKKKRGLRINQRRPDTPWAVGLFNLIFFSRNILSWVSLTSGASKWSSLLDFHFRRLPVKRMLLLLFYGCSPARCTPGTPARCIVLWVPRPGVLYSPERCIVLGTPARCIVLPVPQPV